MAGRKSTGALVIIMLVKVDCTIMMVLSNLIMMVVDGIEELRWGSVFEKIIVMTPITLIMTLMVMKT